MTAPRESDLIRATFDVVDVWVERDGKTTRGKRPAWLDWPMHTAAEMAQGEWNPKRGKGK
jgi:hypothetical protein